MHILKVPAPSSPFGDSVSKEVIQLPRGLGVGELYSIHSSAHGEREFGPNFTQREDTEDIENYGESSPRQERSLWDLQPTEQREKIIFFQH